MKTGFLIYVILSGSIAIFLSVSSMQIGMDSYSPLYFQSTLRGSD